MRAISFASAALLLSGCFPWQAGGDPAGARLKAKASLVAIAIRRYHQDHGRFPVFLQQLVPRYLAILPSEPKLRIDSKHGDLVFWYDPSWPQSGEIVCSCKLGETE